MPEAVLRIPFGDHQAPALDLVQAPDQVAAVAPEPVGQIVLGQSSEM